MLQLCHCSLPYHKTYWIYKSSNIRHQQCFQRISLSRLLWYMASCTHLETSFNLHELWSIVAFKYKQQIIFSIFPMHLFILHPWSSLKPSHREFSHDKPGNCACSNLSNCQEFNSNAFSCWSSKLIKNKKNTFFYFRRVLCTHPFYKNFPLYSNKKTITN